MKKIILTILSLTLLCGCSSNKTENTSPVLKINDDHTNLGVNIEELEDILNPSFIENFEGYEESHFEDTHVDTTKSLYLNDDTFIAAFLNDDGMVNAIGISSSADYEKAIDEVNTGMGIIIGCFEDDETDFQSLIDGASDMFTNCTTDNAMFGAYVENYYLLHMDLIANSDSDVSYLANIGVSEYKDNEEYQQSDDYKHLNETYCIQDDQDTADTTTENQPRTYWGEGMYKVGVDIPAGEYNVIAEEGESAYLDLSSDSTGNSRILNNVFENNMYITVEDGQYLTLKRCYISLE